VNPPSWAAIVLAASVGVLLLLLGAWPVIVTSPLRRPTTRRAGQPSHRGAPWWHRKTPTADRT